MTFKKIFVFLAMLAVSTFCFAQETTGSLQGTVKDPTGAAVPGANVSVATPTLVGVKTEQTDSKGNYHFSNLPPGAYVVTVDAKGFKTLKQSGLVIEVGHSPTLDLSLAVGGAAESVDVTSQTPAIDVTSVTTLTNVTNDVINYVPRGTSFQSVIQFAPSARNEPLMGNTMTNGSGSVSPGNGSNGQSFGYSIAGGSDSENSYLVEGQETANLIGGYSHTSVPFDFIDQVEIKSSGVQAEYGGALGGVINVIMKKGTPHFHGSVFVAYENSGMDSGPNAVPRYNPLTSPTATDWTSAASSLPACTDELTTGCFPGYTGFADAEYQQYQGVKDHYSDTRPGFTLGGPLLPFSDRLPRQDLLLRLASTRRWTAHEEIELWSSVGWEPGNSGNLPFSQNTNTYYTNARIDAQVTQEDPCLRLVALSVAAAEWRGPAPARIRSRATTSTPAAGQYNLSAGSDAGNSPGHNLGLRLRISR